MGDDSGSNGAAAAGGASDGPGSPPKRTNNRATQAMLKRLHGTLNGPRFEEPLGSTRACRRTSESAAREGEQSRKRRRRSSDSMASSSARPGRAARRGVDESHREQRRPFRRSRASDDGDGDSASGSTMDDEEDDDNEPHDDAAAADEGQDMSHGYDNRTGRRNPASGADDENDEDDQEDLDEDDGDEDEDGDVGEYDDVDMGEDDEEEREEHEDPDGRHGSGDDDGGSIASETVVKGSSANVRDSSNKEPPAPSGGKMAASSSIKPQRKVRRTSASVYTLYHLDDDEDEDEDEDEDKDEDVEHVHFPRSKQAVSSSSSVAARPRPPATITIEDDVEEWSSRSATVAPGGGFDNSFEEDSMYCLCKRKPSDDAMVACDLCLEWFHGSCIGVSPAQAAAWEEEDRMYGCPLCCPPNGFPAQPVASPHFQHSIDMLTRQRLAQRSLPSGLSAREATVQRAQPLLERLCARLEREFSGAGFGAPAHDTAAKLAEAAENSNTGDTLVLFPGVAVRRCAHDETCKGLTTKALCYMHEQPAETRMEEDDTAAGSAKSGASEEKQAPSEAGEQAAQRQYAFHQRLHFFGVLARLRAEEEQRLAADKRAEHGQRLRSRARAGAKSLDVVGSAPPPGSLLPRPPPAEVRTVTIRLQRTVPHITTLF